jgi:hypothetical protein
MDPEVRQQLYGGEISDYYPTKIKNTRPETDYKNIGDLYQQILSKQTPIDGSIKDKIVFQ